MKKIIEISDHDHMNINVFKPDHKNNHVNNDHDHDFDHFFFSCS